MRFSVEEHELDSQQKHCSDDSNELNPAVGVTRPRSRGQMVIVTALRQTFTWFGYVLKNL